MAESSKAKGVLESFEVLVGHAVRRPYRRFMRGRFDLLRKQDEKLWRAAAWIYKKQPDQAGDFEKLLLLGLTAGEFFADWAASKTGTLGQIVGRGVQEIMEDTPAVIRDYFSELPDDIFPVDYSGPTSDDFGAIAKRINEFLKESLGVFRNYISGGFLGDFLEFNQGIVVAKTTTRLGPDAMIEFTGWWDGLPKYKQDEYRPALKAINETGEMGLFLLLDSEERETFLRSVLSMGGLHFPLNRRQRRELAVLWRKYYSEPMVELAEWLREENRKINPNYKDEEDWRVEFYSPANLTKYPHRHADLPSMDERRIAYERKQQRNRRVRTIVLVLAVLVGWATMNGSAQTAWAAITHYGWVILLLVVLFVVTVLIRIAQQNRSAFHGE